MIAYHLSHFLISICVTYVYSLLSVSMQDQHGFSVHNQYIDEQHLERIDNMSRHVHDNDQSKIRSLMLNGPLHNDNLRNLAPKTDRLALPVMFLILTFYYK